MMIKVHDVFVVQRSVQLDFSVNLAKGDKTRPIINDKKKPQKTHKLPLWLRAFTFSRWCALETRECGMILAA